MRVGHLIPAFSWSCTEAHQPPLPLGKTCRTKAPLFRGLVVDIGRHEPRETVDSNLFPSAIRQFLIGYKTDRRQTLHKSLLYAWFLAPIGRRSYRLSRGRTLRCSHSHYSICHRPDRSLAPPNAVPVAAQVNNGTSTSRHWHGRCTRRPAPRRMRRRSV